MTHTPPSGSWIDAGGSQGPSLPASCRASGPSRKGAKRAALALTLAAASITSAAWLPGAATAIPRLDLSPYPAPAAAERRWVIQLPGVLPPTTDALISANSADWRVELLVGKELQVDCNGPRLLGRIRSSALPGTGYTIYRVTQVSPPISTRMACPPDRPAMRAFVPMGAKPFVVPYNVSLPIVIYAPKDLEVRWRLWKAERRQMKAQAL